jgi:hypothetical protein
MSDLVTRLRNWRTVHLARLYLLMEEAADEMERLSANGDCPAPNNAAKQDNLKAEVRRLKGVIAAGESEAIAKCDCPGQDNAATQDILTDEEREAIERDLSWLQWCEDNRQIGDVGRKDIATLRGLLQRLG